MMCDIIIAADSAKFGQPEIKLGVIPGIGGTQRLTRAIGKAKAMDLNLTGRMMDAAEAERSGLVARVVPAASLMDEAMKAAETIAGMSMVAVMTAKAAVNRAFETTLAEGILFERRTFQALFATHDQKEGMAAFIEKRPAKFENQVDTTVPRTRCGTKVACIAESGVPVVGCFGKSGAGVFGLAAVGTTSCVHRVRDSNSTSARRSPARPKPSRRRCRMRRRKQPARSAR